MTTNGNLQHQNCLPPLIRPFLGFLYLPPPAHALEFSFLPRLGVIDGFYTYRMYSDGMAL
jgi:hypothetical protein